MTDAAVEPDGWLAWLEATAPAEAMRGWLWLYPAVEVVHIIGIVLLVGSVAMFDLRVLGLSRRLPVSGLARHLLPFSVLGLAILVPSGLLLFSAHATELAANPVFPLKLALIGAGVANAVLFHGGAFRSVRGWDVDAAAPAAAKLSAAGSLAIWVAVITCGRLLAYV